MWELALFAYEWKLIFIIKTMHEASLSQWGSKELKKKKKKAYLQGKTRERGSERGGGEGSDVVL